jgi:hypothetical protein
MFDVFSPNMNIAKGADWKLSVTFSKAFPDKYWNMIRDLPNGSCHSYDAFLAHGGDNE